MEVNFFRSIRFHEDKTLTTSQLEFRILDGLASKPQLPHDLQQHEASHHSGCRSGSDIDVAGYEVATLGSTHLLAVNKFPAARPHFLILTQDGFRRQFEPLDLDDLTAARLALSSFKSRHLLLFNCGIDSGCSRMHKHMQVLPGPDPELFTPWPDAADPRPPFLAFWHRFQAGLPTTNSILDIYRNLVQRAETAIGHPAVGGGPAIPHNVIMTRDWLVVVPRRAAGWEGADTNAAGMLGMICVHNEEKMHVWLNHGPINVLTRLGFPAEAN